MFIQQGSQSVHASGTLMNQSFPAAKYRRARLLFNRLGLHKTHLRLSCRNDNGLGIGRIFFLSLH